MKKIWLITFIVAFTFSLCNITAFAGISGGGKPGPGGNPVYPEVQWINPKIVSNATPTSSMVLVNGKNIEFEAYLINDNNYFKLRDLAYAINGTDKQFDVSWDGISNAIVLTSSSPYTVVGGELTTRELKAKEATLTDSKIIKDGLEVQFTAYLIDGNNYFKLRDVGEAFGFGVDWDGVNNSVIINTDKNYTNTDPSKIPLHFTDGYEFALFSRFNSPASENGLGKTKVYIDCTIERVYLLDTSAGAQIMAYLTDNGGNKWIAQLHTTALVPAAQYDDVAGKSIIFCGVYEGYSGKEQMPYVYLDKLCIKETGEIRNGMGSQLEQGTKIPFYKNEPDVPDFGEMLGVPLHGAADSCYDYSASDIKPGYITTYCDALKESGFQVYKSGSSMSVFKKGNRTVSIMITDDLVFILIETGAY